MTRFLFPVAGVAAALIVAFWTLTGEAGPVPAPPTPAGEVLDLRGSAEALRDESPRDLAPEDAVFVGDLVATAAKSMIEMRLGADSTLRLGESTRLRIEAFMIEEGGEIFLDSGALFVDKDPDSKDRPIAVQSAFGQIAVRGTRFFVGPTNGVFSVFLERGALDVTAAGVTVSLKAGEGTEIAAPGSPPAPATPWGAARIAAAMALVE
ncbi:FecR family protein [Zavarzinia compransoris]|uniref:FecR family protein n=1 Tax=Zavarzinia marina TaxID=2911065 RepID=UPI001F18B51F|nr:FecR family protein [Zavarzinia marina]MCF4166745.1 FecR family protein [Zavarzinia marina]